MLLCNTDMHLFFGHHNNTTFSNLKPKMKLKVLTKNKKMSRKVLLEMKLETHKVKTKMELLKISQQIQMATLLNSLMATLMATLPKLLNEEQKEVDVTLSPEEEQLDEFESILNDAWAVLEVAKQTCEKRLSVVTEEKDICRWKLNLSEPLYFLGQVLMLSDKPEEAKAELINSLEIKQQYLNEDNRELAANLFQIGNSFCQMYNYSDATVYFKKALECLNKKIASLEADKDSKESAEEIEEIRLICGDIQEKINDAIDSEKAEATIKQKFQEEKETLRSHKWCNSSQRCFKLGQTSTSRSKRL
ncbi:Protein HGV2 isoform X4 [Aphelenchoides bicaudatus]|nr:Protein HGV2 isoform X4 [Aphelenchoides bicaudatus]